MERNELSWHQQVGLQPPESCKTSEEPSNRDWFHDWPNPRTEMILQLAFLGNLGA